MKSGDKITLKSGFGLSDSAKSIYFPKVNLDFNANKKEVFEKKITHRIRLSRMACIQSIYMWISNIASSKISTKMQRSLFDISDEDVKPEIFCRSIIYIYKHHVLNKKIYGDTPKNKRIDETFLFNVVQFAHANVKKIDAIIQKHLSDKWRVDSLDFTIKSILRCAIAESMVFTDLETAIITSEYTNLATYFFNGKSVGFVNGVLHSYCSERKKSKVLL